MWKLLIVSAVLMHLGEAQRSTYAGRPGSKSKLLAKFKNSTTESPLGTRGGEENESSTELPSDLQGTLEDHDFVNRVSKWPEDRQPFWYKNRLAISSMRGQEIDGGKFMSPSLDNNQRPRPQFQSPFQGAGRGRGVGQGMGRRIGQGMGRGRPRNEDSFESDDYYRRFENIPSMMYLKRLHNS